jgi:hypothetical protein
LSLCLWLSLVAIAPVAVLLSGCETITWQRPGGDETVMREDLRDCQWRARLYAPTELSRDPFAVGRGWSGPVPCRVPPDRRPPLAGSLDCPSVAPFGTPLAERSVFSNRARIEYDFIDRCMRDKGYAKAVVEAGS